MKIESIELTWFRGASEKAKLITNLKNIVVYGENASGKSSFVDAIEYIITKGKIDHLRGEYSDRNQRNCVRNTETPEDVDSKATIKFADDQNVYVVIPESERVQYKSTPDNLIEEIQSWKRQSHILRQDEVGEFIDITKSKKYSTLSPIIGLKEFEDMFTNIKNLVKQVKQKSNYDVLTYEKNRIREELIKILGTLDEDKIIVKMKDKIQTYDVQFDKDIKTTSHKVTDIIQDKINEFSPEIKRYIILNNIKKTTIIELIAQYKELIKETEKLINEFLEHKISILELSEKYLAWEELEDIIDCPVCGEQISKDELREHVRNELESLTELRKMSHKTRLKKREILQSYNQYRDDIQSDDEFQEWLKDPENTELQNLIITIREREIPNENEAWNIVDLVSIEDTISNISTILKPLLEAEPPSVKELQTDLEYFVTVPKIEKYKILKEKIEKLDKLMKSLNHTQKNIREKIVEITTSTLDEISEEVRRIWLILHEDEPIEEIKLMKSKATDTGIDITLKFYGNELPSPGLTLSEGYRNSLGLCIFLALAKQEPEDHPLFLDDIVSSLDREHRGFLVDILNNELQDRQILLFTHDREWFDELTRRLDRRNWEFFSLKKWVSPKEGIQVSPTHFTFDQARQFLPDETNAAGNAVRAIMDDELARIAEKIEVSYPLVRGPKNDHRTCIELIEGIISQGKLNYRIKPNGQWQTYQEAIDYWEGARELLVTWANRSSHGGSLTDDEARRMIERCSQSLNFFKCPECDKPVWLLEKESEYRRCDCGKVRWKI